MHAHISHPFNTRAVHTQRWNDIVWNDSVCCVHHHHLPLNRRWFYNQFPPFFPVLHCPLGPGELYACPFPDVAFPPLPLSVLFPSSMTLLCCFSPKDFTVLFQSQTSSSVLTSAWELISPVSLFQFTSVKTISQAGDFQFTPVGSEFLLLLDSRHLLVLGLASATVCTWCLVWHYKMQSTESYKGTRGTAEMKTHTVAGAARAGVKPDWPAYIVFSVFAFYGAVGGISWFCQASQGKFAYFSLISSWLVIFLLPAHDFFLFQTK